MGVGQRHACSPPGPWTPRRRGSFRTHRHVPPALHAPPLPPDQPGPEWVPGVWAPGTCLPVWSAFQLPHDSGWRAPTPIGAFRRPLSCVLSPSSQGMRGWSGHLEPRDPRHKGLVLPTETQMLLCAECVLPTGTFVPLGLPVPGPLCPQDLWAEIQPLSSRLLVAACTMGTWGTLGCPSSHPGHC